MSKFELVPLDEAMMNPATGKRAQNLAEYVRFIDRLEKGRAGKIQPSEGETVTAVWRRLSAAASLAGKDPVIRRAGDEVYFWTASGKRGRPRVRRGRPRKASTSEQQSSGSQHETSRRDSEGSPDWLWSEGE